MTSLWDQIRDWVLLVVLLLVSLGVMFSHNDPLVDSVRAQSMQVTAQIESTFAWLGHYFRALEENSMLREKNIELTSDLARSRDARSENERLRALLGVRDTTSHEMQAARVVSKDITQQQNMITIDVGKQDGISEGMPVVNDQGIVGKVVLTSDQFARVIPFLNTDFRVPAKILPSEAEGIVRWEGSRSDRLRIEHIVNTEPVDEGDEVVTSGHSGVFPAGWDVGTVASVERRAGRNELSVQLTPAVAINKVEHAFVILHETDDELEALESTPVR